MTKAQVVEATTLCYGTIWKMMQEDRFPRSKQLSERSVGWDADEVEEWLASRPRTILKADKVAAAAAGPALAAARRKAEQEEAPAPARRKAAARAGERHVR